MRERIPAPILTHISTMPATYTHHLIAREAYAALPHSLQNKIHNLPLYFFGAQGPDFCFFYRSLNPKAKNLGSYLHREGGFPAFCVLKSLAARDPQILSYALGYVTHYAADSTFHPYVYATTGNSPLRHSRLENILDIRFKRQAEPSEYDPFFHGKLSEQEKDELFFIYTAIALRARFPVPKKPAFLRSIALFNAYLPIPNTLFDGSNAQVRAFAANEEKRTWAYPAAPKITSCENADELLEKAITLSVTLMESFLSAVKTNAALDRALFGKGFLTGI